MTIDNTTLANFLYETKFTCKKGYDFQEVVEIVCQLDDHCVMWDDNVELGIQEYDSLEEALDDYGYTNLDKFIEEKGALVIRVSSHVLVLE